MVRARGGKVWGLADFSAFLNIFLGRIVRGVCSGVGCLSGKAVPTGGAGARSVESGTGAKWKGMAVDVDEEAGSTDINSLVTSLIPAMRMF